MSSESARSYHSPRRRVQAAQTRAAILEAATHLFAEFGWSGTSMRRVAAAADVSMETVYAGFGNKADLFAALMDVAVVGDDLPIPLADRDVSAQLSSGTVSERVAKAASMSAEISGRTCELVQALTQASVTDANLAQRLGALDERRRREIGHYFEQVTARHPTQLELNEVWLITSAEVFHLLVHRSSWTIEQHEKWLANRLMELISRAPTETPGRVKKIQRKGLS